MEPDNNFSPQDSLQLIQSMIENTRSNMRSKSHYFLVWGWLTFFACTGQFVLKHIVQYHGHYHVWWLMIVAMLYTIWFSAKEGREQKVRTYIGESMSYLWTGMGISYFVLGFIISKAGWGGNVFPIYIMLYGLGTFVSGRLIRFSPLVIGGIAAWALAILSVYLSYDYQILAAAAAILVSYIIPGHLLRRHHSPQII
jgi:hypothetical protein